MSEDISPNALPWSGREQVVWYHLTARQREVFLLWPDAWMAASEVLGSRIAGNTASILADKGLFDRRSDPNVWGRSQYRIVADYKAARAYLMSEPK